MFANLRIGLSWLRSAVAWRVVEGSLVFYAHMERRLGKLRRLGDPRIRR